MLKKKNWPTATFTAPVVTTTEPKKPAPAGFFNASFLGRAKAPPAALNRR